MHRIVNSSTFGMSIVVSLEWKNGQTEIRRGDIFSYDFGTRIGSIQSGVRPVLVIQADNFNANAPTVIVASITSVIKKRYLPSHIILGEGFGLMKPSMVLLEQIQTVNKDDLTEYIGFVDDERLWRQINAGILIVTDLLFRIIGKTAPIFCHFVFSLVP